MKLNQEQINLLNKNFDFHIKYLTSHIRKYQQNLIEVIKEKESVIELDKQFIYDLVEDGFILTTNSYIGDVQKEIQDKKDYMNQIKDLLNPYEE